MIADRSQLQGAMPKRGKPAVIVVQDGAFHCQPTRDEIAFHRFFSSCDISSLVVLCQCYLADCSAFISNLISQA